MLAIATLVLFSQIGPPTNPVTIERYWTVPNSPGVPASVYTAGFNPYYGADHNITNPLLPVNIPANQPRFAHPEFERLRAMPGFPWQ